MPDICRKGTALIIGGFPRSGTTLVRSLCHEHPEVMLTMEFDNLTVVGQSPKRFVYNTLLQWWNNRTRSFLVQGQDETRLASVVKSHIFVTRYLTSLGLHARRRVAVADIESALRSVFPAATVVGDKMPSYVFRLAELVQIDGLVRVIIYRDCRDLTSSVLRMARTEWQGKPFTRRLDTADKIANRWVQAIDLMEEHAAKLHTIRYEDLVQGPGYQLDALARLLGIDPAAFPIAMVRKDGTGKYHDGLSRDELETVMQIAGPSMARLGYS